ncbi:MFS transporter [Chromobacterium sp. ATCC 53434]|uniref:MFS transporter n=1 Tax=Chromobacterium sp. (strain ATCC 53434 / SC 14030) TaxID=2059672 RepID=UPI000C7884A3|nr:MFS transporter [Chromobacterium sp. ATCC 53434]AUH51361.1 MFS transporter [Chromobacterium sp. ATCC 53434]
MSVSQAGALVSVFALTVALAGPPATLVLSRRSRRGVLTACLSVFAAACAAMALAPNYPVLLLSRVAPALLHPVFFALAFVAAAALYPPRRAAEASAKAFIGTSMGMVLGIPATGWLATRFSYEAACLFGSAMNGAAALGLWFCLPDAPTRRGVGLMADLAILRRPALWLNLAGATLIFAAMFCVYGYAAVLLRSEARVGEEAANWLLLLFGAGGLAGNILGGRAMGRNRVVAAVLHPGCLIAAYLPLFWLGSLSWPVLAGVAAFWGAAHTSGLVVTQVWLSAEAPDAPEFLGALYISFINLGVALGSALGGWLIGRQGMPGTMAGGMACAAAAWACVAMRGWLARHTGRPTARCENTLS